MTLAAETALSEFIRSMPKAELHIHLEGAIQPETVLELARRHQRLASLPGNSVQILQDWFTFTDFPHFIKIYMVVQDLLRSEDDFALIAYECGADMAAQNICYREVTVTPFTHIHLQDKGLTIDHILNGLERGRRQARLEFGVEIRWVLDIPRNFCFSGRNGYAYDPFPAQETLAYALAGQERGVVGLGLGGNEVDAPPEPFAHAFKAAKAAGLLSLPHAGETVGPASVWGAVIALQADRIGHGVRAIEDPHLLALIQAREIALEVNSTSNICLHVYRRLAEHPFPHLDRMGLRVTVNSDDPPFFNTSLNQEYALLATEFGYTQADLLRLARNAFLASGAEPDLKLRLLADFDAWATGQADHSF